MFTLSGWYLIVMINGQVWGYFQPRPMDDLQDCLNNAVAWESQFSTASMNPVCLDTRTREVVDNLRGTNKRGASYILRGAHKSP